MPVTQGPVLGLSGLWKTTLLPGLRPKPTGGDSIKSPPRGGSANWCFELNDRARGKRAEVLGFLLGDRPMPQVQQTPPQMVMGEIRARGCQGRLDD